MERDALKLNGLFSGNKNDEFCITRLAETPTSGSRSLRSAAALYKNRSCCVSFGENSMGSYFTCSVFRALASTMCGVS